MLLATNSIIRASKKQSSYLAIARSCLTTSIPQRQQLSTADYEYFDTIKRYGTISKSDGKDIEYLGKSVIYNRVEQSKIDWIRVAIIEKHNTKHPELPINEQLFHMHKKIDCFKKAKQVDEFTFQRSKLCNIFFSTMRTGIVFFGAGLGIRCIYGLGYYIDNCIYAMGVSPYEYIILLCTPILYRWFTSRHLYHSMVIEQSMSRLQNVYNPHTLDNITQQLYHSHFLKFREQIIKEQNDLYIRQQ